MKTNHRQDDNEGHKHDAEAHKGDISELTNGLFERHEITETTTTTAAPSAKTVTLANRAGAIGVRRTEANRCGKDSRCELIKMLAKVCSFPVSFGEPG